MPTCGIATGGGGCGTHRYHARIEDRLPIVFGIKAIIEVDIGSFAKIATTSK
jgi:hypothetical protein